MKKSVYEIVTAELIARLENGVVPWRKPWTGGGYAPANLVSKKAYRGINHFLLEMNNFSSPWYVSYKQAADLGGNVKKGAVGNMVTFWTLKKYRETDSAGDVTEKKIPFIRYYKVFNAMEQCEGLENRIPASAADAGGCDFTPLQAAENIVTGYTDRPEIIHQDKSRAFYSPSLDHVNMPLGEQFTRPEEYYSTLFHELIHSTGHKKRLDRDFSGGFGSDPYAREELIAEMGASFLCGVAGIENDMDQSASYLHGWIKALKGDAKLAIRAASAAQAAADYIQGITFEPAQDETREESKPEKPAAPAVPALSQASLF